MTQLLTLPDLPFWHWFWLLFCALLIGMDKAGVKGLGMIVIPLLAFLFGGKASAGLLVPMLVVADAFAVRHYNRHADWSYLWKLLPAALAGLLLGVWVGDVISDDLFKGFIAVFIIGSLALMLWQERAGLPLQITESRVFGGAFGLLGGFMSMIGNAAGPIMAVYLLSTRLPKNNFIGTGAWFFFLINAFKLPFHVWIWGTIDGASLLLNLVAVPAIVLGVFLGVRLVGLLPEREFRYFVLVMTTLIALRLVWQAV